jgi:hypothetical protein
LHALSRAEAWRLSANVSAKYIVGIFPNSGTKVPLAVNSSELLENKEGFVMASAFFHVH